MCSTVQPDNSFHFRVIVTRANWSFIYKYAKISAAFSPF